MSVYTAYVIYLQYVIRFPQANIANFRPPPDRKDKKADVYHESVGQLGLLDPPSTYDIKLHYAIAHMCSADSALPRFHQAPVGKRHWICWQANGNPGLLLPSSIVMPCQSE